jgi:hypothetical protein
MRKDKHTNHPVTEKRQILEMIEEKHSGHNIAWEILENKVRGLDRKSSLPTECDVE